MLDHMLDQMFSRNGAKKRSRTKPPFSSFNVLNHNEEVGIRKNMRRWWRLGKVVCMCIYHKYTFVLACMHICVYVMCVGMYAGR